MSYWVYEDDVTNRAPFTVEHAGFAMTVRECREEENLADRTTDGTDPLKMKR